MHKEVARFIEQKMSGAGEPWNTAQRWMVDLIGGLKCILFSYFVRVTGCNEDLVSKDACL